MKQILFFALIILLGSLLNFTAQSQSEYTTYDDFPGLIKSYKPAYNESYPEWAKPLYEFPINYHYITRSYSQTKGEVPIEFSAVHRYYKLWIRAIEPWVKDDGNIHIPDLNKYYNALQYTQLTIQAPFTTGKKTESDWSFLGPKETYWLNESGSSTPPKACPWQVNVYSFDVAVTDNNILFAGTETGFVNKSIDQGLNWSMAPTDYFFGGGVTAIAIHPEDADIVYAAAGNQIHKTTDGGESWMPMLGTGDLFHADRLKIDSLQPDKILAAATDGVYITTDGGISWEKTWNKRAYDIELKVDDNNIVYALSKSSGMFTLVISTDGGETFELDDNFPTSIQDESGGLLAVTPADPNKLIAVMLSEDYTPYLYQADIEEESWSLLATGQTNWFPMNNGQGYFDLVLEISPVDEDIIFAGTTTLFKSVNGGATFTTIGGYSGAFSIHPDIQDMKMLANGDTWVSTDGGFSLSTDNFSNTNNYFSRNNGLVGSDMWGFDQGWNEDIVVGGRYHNGNTAIADFYQPKALRMGGAESPTGWVLQGKSRHVAFNDLGNGWILPPTAEEQHEGRFIFSKYPNMDEYGGRRGNMVFHPNFYGTVFLGEGNGFWKSLDMGVSWDLMHDFNAKVRYLQISYHNPEVLYADIVNQGLFRSDDGGLNWESKPALTNGQNGNSYWKGRTFFAISPFDEDVIYACLQNGTWSSDIGEIYRSEDGGESWEDWTGTLSEYTKCLVIQPSENNTDLVYCFTNARNGQAARVFIREENDDDWETFENNYPSGMAVNMALPFYRDSKLRVAGGAGVWESPMAEPDFSPIINPWVEKSFYNCMTDTLYFDDHSILNHEGASWTWSITPEPEYMEDAAIRNPKVVLGEPGTYSVTFSVTQDGQTYTKELPDMITATTCPSIEDCSNPAELPKDSWELLYVDSEETNYPGLATMAFDNNPSTIWHTSWSTGNDPYPHEMIVDMGEIYKIYKFIVLNRQDGQNGRIKDYELYISEDNLNWGDPVSTGEFINTSAPQTVEFNEVAPIGRYFRLLALSEVNGNAWASAAEISFVGCTDLTSSIEPPKQTSDLKGFPMPTSGSITLPLPEGYDYHYKAYSSSGMVVQTGEINNRNQIKTLDLNKQIPGTYIIRLWDQAGHSYRVKVIKI